MIICFSGTGNSAAVARELSARLGGKAGRVVTLEGELLTSPQTARLELAGADEPVIWCFPIHAWAPPKMVEQFLRRVRIKGCGERTPHYMVCTCGDDVGIAHRRWARMVGRRGWSPRAAWSVEMPNTYVCLPGFDTDAPEVERRKLAAMPERVGEIARLIAGGRCGDLDDVVAGRMAWSKTEILRPLFRAFCMSPRPFVCDPAKCVTCGLCARQCPVGNIEMSGGHPRWGNRCTMCLRCLHCCPVSAIDYGAETRQKGRYRYRPDASKRPDTPPQAD